VAVDYQEDDAIYLVNGISTEAGFHRSTGLWRFDIATHGLTRLADRSSYWSEAGLGSYVGLGAAWRTDIDPNDPSPDGSRGRTSTNRLVRLDLKTGATSYWLTRHGAEVAMIGPDAQGYPLVAVRSQQTTEVWHLTGPEQGSLVYKGPFSAQDGIGPYEDGTSGGYRPRQVLLDSHGMWISTSDGRDFHLLLYTSGRLEKMPSIGLDDAVHAWHPAGGCTDR
jgi:hypothetical protein